MELKTKDSIQKSIQKWKNIKLTLINMKCPLCEEYRSIDGCGICPIKDPARNCAKELLDIYSAIDKFIKYLEDL